MAVITLLKTEETAKIPEAYFRERMPERFEKAEKFRFEKDRQRCLGAGLLLYGVCHLKEEDLSVNPQGKLFCADGRMQFNLSHSGDYAALVTADSEAGIDIEEEREDHLKVAGRVFQPSEIRWMEEKEEERIRRFFILWTLKESVMKAAGLGFCLPPESFNVLPLLKGEPVEICGRKRYGKTLDFPGYGLSVCTEREEDIIIRKLTASDFTITT